MICPSGITLGKYSCPCYHIKNFKPNLRFSLPLTSLLNSPVNQNEILNHLAKIAVIVTFPQQAYLFHFTISTNDIPLRHTNTFFLLLTSVIQNI